MARVRVSVTSRDHGAERTKRRLRDLAASPAVEVGIIGDQAAADHGEGVTVGRLAEWHEYGLGVPERSWLRGWVDSAESTIAEAMRRLTERSVKGRVTPQQAALQLGVWCVGKIQQRIARGIEPALHERTIERKGSSVPLIDTGQLRQSITSRTVAP